MTIGMAVSRWNYYTSQAHYVYPISHLTCTLVLQTILGILHLKLDKQMASRTNIFY